MKKILLVLLVGLVGVCFADSGWWTKERIESFHGGMLVGQKITAVAYCDTEKEAEKICGCYIMDYNRVATDMPDDDIPEERWLIVFLEYEQDLPKFAIYHFIPHGPVETYIIFW